MTEDVSDGANSGLLQLSLRDFRCHAERIFPFQPGLNVLYGANGQGKTSVLEAVGYLSTVRSFRRAPEAEMIRFGASGAEIAVRFTRSGSPKEHTLSAELGAKRVLRADGEPVDAPRDMLGRLPSVVFAPEDIALVRDGPAERRRFLDILLSQLRPRYVAELTRCRRLLRDKQRLLTRISDKPSFAEMLPEFDRRLSEAGAYITEERARVTARLSEAAARHHAAVSSDTEVLEIRLLAQAHDAARYHELFQRRRESEIARRQCLVGPHRDDLELGLNGRSLRAYGSQGQLRTAALALKLAQRDIFLEELGASPILLLDDVLSELDAGRREYLLTHVGGGQTLLTACGDIEGAGDAWRIEL